MSGERLEEIKRRMYKMIPYRLRFKMEDQNTLDSLSSEWKFDRLDDDGQPIYKNRDGIEYYISGSGLTKRITLKVGD